MAMQILKSISWVVVSLFAGCEAPAPDVEQESAVMGRSGFFAEALPTPDVKATAILRKFGGFLVSQAPRIEASAAARHGLDAVIYEGLLKFGGLPRWQLRHALAELVGPTSQRCGGQSCARLFQLETSQIDEFLDEMYKKSAQSAELKKPEKVLVRRMILGSLQPENRPQAGRAQARVRFKNLNLEKQVRNQLGIQGPLRATDLDKTKVLRIDTWALGQNTTLEDLSRFVHLERLELSYHDSAILQDVVRYAKNIRALDLSPFGLLRGNVRTYKSLTYDEMEVLASVPHLTSLALHHFDTRDMEKVARNFYNLKELEVETWYVLSEDGLQAMGKMPNLRKFTLQIPYQMLPMEGQVRLPRSIQTVEFQGRGLGCGNLANLRIFSNASNMKISGCTISSVGDDAMQFGWQQLAFQGCKTLGDARIVLSVKASNFPSLEVFQSDNPALDLDAASREYMTVNLARSAKGG